jgi:hypothetical protein
MECIPCLCNGTGEKCTCDLSEDDPCPRYVPDSPNAGKSGFDFSIPCEQCIPCPICGGEGWFIVDDEGNGSPGYDEKLIKDLYPSDCRVSR